MKKARKCSGRNVVDYNNQDEDTGPMKSVYSNDNYSPQKVRQNL